MTQASAKPAGGSRSFRFFVVTQFLGAFNDNAFKQLVLLLAVDLAAEEGGGSYQSIAMAVFALPFLVFSGFAGSLADRYPKTYIIVTSKAAEAVIMGMGAIGFALGSIGFLLVTLFLMGTQSAFFGPAKYGILPEMLERRRLASANGVMLMTTFLAIILGQAAAGTLKDEFPDRLWLPALVYVGLAVIGTLTALGVRKVPAAQPGLPLRGRWAGDLGPSLRAISRDKTFLLVIAAYSYFWFVGGVMQPTMNSYGKDFLGLDDTGTSYLLVTLSLGMAVGGVLGGIICRRGVDFRLTRIGIVGVIATLIALPWAHPWVALVHGTLFLLGVSGSLFGLPLQTWVQAWPPEAEKGRIVAAANFVNWVFICLSALWFGLSEVAMPGARWYTLPLAGLTVVVAGALWPRLASLERKVREERAASGAAGAETDGGAARES